MIQDIQEAYHVEYTPIDPSDEDSVFVFSKNQIYGKMKGQELICPSFRQIKGNVQYLFSIGERHVYLALEEQTIKGFEYLSVRTLRHCQPKLIQFAGATAYHLYTWYSRTKYCGSCGHELEHSIHERAMQCPKCKSIYYPMIAPAVIVGVIHKDSILMTRYAGRAYKGHALIAGFCEIGESPEDTVIREVQEEVGLKVKNIRYYKSQPWGFDSNILMGFYCDLDGDPTITLEKEELAKARFIPMDEIIDEWEDLSLTNEMIIAFKEGKI